ncbi:glycosyltransferase family 4 protein [Shewanella sp.]|uniref:glycosyltransferase family 4 protein n=1 Tax=Shewanella sp. TaxID=50422 RepID=UPI0040475851
MKLLVLSQYFWPESFRINEVARSLREKGVEVGVLTGKPNYPGGSVFPGYKAAGYMHETHQGMDIHRVPLFPRGRGRVRLAINYLSFIASGLLCAPWRLRGKHFDAVFVYAPSPILQAIPAIIIGKIKRCPVVLWVQDLWPESLSATGHVRNRVLLKTLEWVVRGIYRQCDMLLVQSRAFEAPVRALAGRTPVLYYPNSVGDEFSQPAGKAPPAVEGMDEGFSVMFAGNIGSAQAVETILEAAAILREQPDIHFVVLGEGSRRAWMRAEAERMALVNLHLPGNFPVETMPALMQKASVLLVTLADHPIFRLTIPSKINAYMAAGRPIIACLNGAGAEIVKDANAGVTVPAEDASALAQAVKGLYAMQTHERLEMGARGRKYYEEHFSHEKLVDELIVHLDQVVRLYQRKTV